MSHEKISLFLFCSVDLLKKGRKKEKEKRKRKKKKKKRTSIKVLTPLLFIRREIVFGSSPSTLPFLKVRKRKEKERKEKGEKGKREKENKPEKR